jgi:hypothetical protein
MLRAKRFLKLVRRKLEVLGFIPHADTCFQSWIVLQMDSMSGQTTSPSGTTTSI